MRYIPTWISELTNHVLSDFHEKPCRLVYMCAEKGHKSGRCFYKRRILVIKCFDENSEFNRAIVLHELAHLLDTRGQGRHDKIFYYIVELLYSRYGIKNKVASEIEEIVPRDYWRSARNWKAKVY